MICWLQSIRMTLLWRWAAIRTFTQNLEAESLNENWKSISVYFSVESSDLPLPRIDFRVESNAWILIMTWNVSVFHNIRGGAAICSRSHSISKQFNRILHQSRRRLLLLFSLFSFILFSLLFVQPLYLINGFATHLFYYDFDVRWKENKNGIEEKRERSKRNRNINWNGESCDGRHKWWWINEKRNFECAAAVPIALMHGTGVLVAVAVVLCCILLCAHTTVSCVDSRCCVLFWQKKPKEVARAHDYLFTKEKYIQVSIRLALSLRASVWANYYRFLLLPPSSHLHSCSDYKNRSDFSCAKNHDIDEKRIRSHRHAHTHTRCVGEQKRESGNNNEMKTMIPKRQNAFAFNS